MTRLQHEREAKGWSQEYLAARAGISTQTVWRLETNTSSARRLTAQKLCRVLGIPAREYQTLQTEVG